MNKVNKKEVRLSIEDAIRQSLVKFDISIPSKKTQKLLESSARKISEQIKEELKKRVTKTAKKKKASASDKNQAVPQKVA